MAGNELIQGSSAYKKYGRARTKATKNVQCSEKSGDFRNQKKKMLFISGLLSNGLCD